MGNITQLLARARSGDRAAFDSLFDVLYPELHRIAHLRLGRNVRDTLMDTTALVRECDLKLAQSERLKAQDRVHFLSYAATVMRSIIVDAARARLAARRRGDVPHVTFDTHAAENVANPEEQILDVHAAFEGLAQLDTRWRVSSRCATFRYEGR